MTQPDLDPGTARYVFRVTVRIEPTTAGVSVDPDQFDTTLYRAADDPGEEGWLFFRDNLWHGEINNRDHFRELTEDALGVPVAAVSFSELQTTEAYLEALRAAIADDLASFNANTVDQVVSKFLGSSIRVVAE